MMYVQGYHFATVAVRKNVSLLLLLNRSSARAQTAEENLRALIKETGSETKVQTVPCDLMNFASVRQAADDVIHAVGSYGGLDVLCNNAGIAFNPDLRTADGFDVQMQTNHLSHFLLAKLLLGVLNDAASIRGQARIVQHSSLARNDGDDLEAKYFEKSDPQTLGGDVTRECFTRYHMTKLANAVSTLHELTARNTVLQVFTMALKKELDARGMENIKSVVCEPGIAATGNLHN